MRLGRFMLVAPSKSTQDKIDVGIVSTYPLNMAIAKLLTYNNFRSCKWSGELPLPLLELTNPEASPVLAARQAYISMLFSSASGGPAPAINNIMVDGMINTELHETLVRLLELSDSSLAARVDEPLESQS